jgi:hypothetical protein
MKICLPLLALALGLFTAGCSTTPKAAMMTPGKVEIQKRSDKPVKVVVEGEPKIEKVVVIKNDELAKAVQLAIERSQLFSMVDQTTAQGFLLEVAVVGYNPPRPGFNMSATMTTRWKLTRLPGKETVFEDFLKKTHKCTVGDAFAGATRMRKANEGVVRDTISDGLKRISETGL